MAQHISDKKPVEKRAYKTWLFKVLAVLFPFILLVVLELLLRLFSYGHDLRIFVQDAQNADCLVANPHFSERYFTITQNATIGNFEPFKKVKQKGTVRLFVLGESTTIGFPYIHNGSFHRWLKYRLMQMYPDIDFEVVNLSLTAVNSFTVRDIANELVPYQPDAVLIYCGHNEYYGALGAASTSSLGHDPYMIRALIKLKQYRLIQLLFNGYNALFKRSSSYTDVRKTLMERMAADQQIALNSAVYKSGIDQFTQNIDAVCKMFSGYHIPVLLSTLVSNEKDLQPFISDRQHDAIQLFKQANDKYASGKLKEAKNLFIQAKDQDLLRFRAPEEINRQIIAISKRYPLVTLVNTRLLFEQNSPNGIIDKKTMLEHVHPNLYGYALLSEAFFQTLSKLKIPKRQATRVMTFNQLLKQMPVTVADSSFGAYAVAQLRKQWPFNERSIVVKPLNEEEAIGYQMAFNGLKWNDAMDKLMTHYQQLKDTANMIKVSEAVMLEYTTDPTFYAFAGKLCNGVKDYERGCNYLNRAFRMRPGMELAQELFLAELAQEHLDKAITYINYGLTQQPDNQKLQNVKQMIQKMTALAILRAEPKARKQLAYYYDILGASDIANKYKTL